MKVVYFDRDLADQVPSLIGSLCPAPRPQWVTLVDIMNALDRGEPVEIRPASEAEHERAEGIVVLGRINAQLEAAHSISNAATLCRIGAQLAAPLIGLLDSSTTTLAAGHAR
ncbi:hypothetical protein GPY61_31870 [Massilia sp. NEAU-DD11]|uniref:Uncharacterized protein n=1 Tax=Massilia cellulosiltytica TaxID=2683234 RepID=A0A7X3KBL5_9BURK|nr:hypothetical protein [Telluria cellulosilytica]MVW64520.1 hypothetical protein [Telluria cellulosilytica]